MPCVKHNIVKWSSENLTKFHGSANAPNFRARREQCGATQSEIAKACGVSVQTVKNWEKGRTAIPEIAFSILDWFERPFAIAEKLAKDFMYPEVRIPFFRTLGELVWWTSTLKDPLKSFAQIFVCPWFYDKFREDDEKSKELLQSLDTVDMFGLFDFIDSDYSYDEKKFVTSIAKETSIGRANKFFEVVASVLESRGQTYTWYYLDQLNNFDEMRDMPPFFYERHYYSIFKAPYTIPSESSAETASEYDELYSSRLAKGTVSGSCVWSIDGQGILRIKPNDGLEIGLLGDVHEWENYLLDVRRVEITGHVVAPRDCRNLFSGFSGMLSADLSMLDTSNVEDMSGMFSGCESLLSLDLSTFDTSNVKDMCWMFEGCSFLQSLDLSAFETSNVTNMAVMFGGCFSLTSLNLSGFDTSRVTNMDGMFDGCARLSKLDLSSFDVSNADNLKNMFDGTPWLMTLDKCGEEIRYKSGYYD
jgi:surface protein